MTIIEPVHKQLPAQLVVCIHDTLSAPREEPDPAKWRTELNYVLPA